MLALCRRTKKYSLASAVVSPVTVTVNWATANDTATAPADYTADTGTLTFTPGDTTKTITVAVQGDLLDEINERYFVNLSGAVLQNLNLSGAALTNCRLTGVMIDGVSLEEMIAVWRKARGD